MDYFDELETRLAELTAAGAHLRRRRRGVGFRWRPLPALALAVSVLVVAGVVAVVLSARPSKPAVHPGHRTANAAISPLLVRNYRILRRPVRPSDALPARLTYGRAPYSFAPSLARRVVISGSRIEMWVVPGQSGFCIDVAQRPGGFIAACKPATNPPQIAVALGGASGQTVLASGLVPDEVTSLVLVSAHGHRSPVRLTSGFFAVPYQLGERLYAIRNGQADRLLPFAAPPPRLGAGQIKLLSAHIPGGSFTLTIQATNMRRGRSICLAYDETRGNASTGSGTCAESGHGSPQPLVLTVSGPTVCKPHPTELIWGLALPSLQIELLSKARHEVAARKPIQGALLARGNLFYVWERGFPARLVARNRDGGTVANYPAVGGRTPPGCKAP